MNGISRLLAHQLVQNLTTQERSDITSYCLWFGREQLIDPAVELRGHIRPSGSGWQAEVVCIDKEDRTCCQRLVLDRHCRSRALADILVNYTIQHLRINQSDVASQTFMN